MKIITTKLPGVVVFEPKKYGDKRGFFLETYRADVLQDAGVNIQFVQDILNVLVEEIEDPEIVSRIAARFQGIIQHADANK